MLRNVTGCQFAGGLLYCLWVEDFFTMFYLEVNGIAASRSMSRKRAVAQAATGHALRPDAVVWLMSEDRATGRAVPEVELY